MPGTHRLTLSLACLATAATAAMAALTAAPARAQNAPPPPASASGAPTVSTDQASAATSTISQAAAGSPLADLPTTTSYRLAPGDALEFTFALAPRPGQRRAIAAGDRLAVAIHIDYPRAGRDYLVQPGDEITLNFPFSPTLSRAYTEQEEERLSVLSRPYLVQPDGTLVLPRLKAPMVAGGKTTLALRGEIEAAYKDILRVPTVEVSVDPQLKREEALARLVQPEGAEPLFEIAVPEGGVIALPLIPALETASRTLAVVSEAATARYRELGYERVSVTLLPAELAPAAASGLARLLGPSGAPLRAEVLPTGEISLPLLPALPVAGRGAAQVGQEVTRRYRALGLGELLATARVAQARPRFVRVLGAVAAPGVYPLAEAADLWGAVARAGGFASGADRSAVRLVPAAAPASPATDLVPPGPDAPAAAATYDFDRFAREGDASANPPLAGGELIIVPGGAAR